MLEPFMLLYSWVLSSKIAFTELAINPISKVDVCPFFTYGDCRVLTQVFSSRCVVYFGAGMSSLRKLWWWMCGLLWEMRIFNKCVYEGIHCREMNAEDVSATWTILNALLLKNSFQCGDSLLSAMSDWSARPMHSLTNVKPHSPHRPAEQAGNPCHRDWQLHIQ